MKKSNTLLSLGVLIKRNVKLFLKDKMTVFFSMLAPVIVLLIYILFLGNLQVDSMQQMLASEGIGSDVITNKDLHAIINNWMIAGVMGVSCVTVALNANAIMVRDKANGNMNDALSSPVKRWVVYVSYIASAFIITLTIALVVLVIALCYLAGSGGFMLSFVDVLSILGITILSTISSACFAALICSFMTPSALAAATGVFGACIGFLMGAYLPFSMLPKVVGWIGCFVPGTYSVGLFKQVFLNGLFDDLTSKLAAVGKEDFIVKLFDQYSVNLEIFGHEISAGWMIFALLISIVLFGSLILILYSNKKTNFFAVGKKKKKSKVKVVASAEMVKGVDAAKTNENATEVVVEEKDVNETNNKTTKT